MIILALSICPANVVFCLNCGNHHGIRRNWAILRVIRLRNLSDELSSLSSIVSSVFSVSPYLINLPSKFLRLFISCLTAAISPTPPPPPPPKFDGQSFTTSEL